MTTTRFDPSGPLRGSIVAPSDKSISHRAALLAGFGDGETTISRYLDSEDTRSSLAAIAALGATVGSTPDGDGSLEVRVGGFGLRGAREPSDPIDAGNAGTLIRLLAGLLAGQDGRSFVLDGDESIRRRPMARVADPLGRMGARARTAAGGVPPIEIDGAPLHGAAHELPVASAQVKSSLLLAGLLADGKTSVTEPAETRDHTERMLAACGVNVASEREIALPTDLSPGTISLAGAERIALPPMTVPGDPSSAAFHLVAATITPRSDVWVRRVGLNPTRIALLGILNRMGAIVEVEERGWEAGEPVGDVRTRFGSLRGTRVEPAEVALAIDELPLVGLLGCFAEGTTAVRGAAELRHKESDRIAGVVNALRAMGGEVEDFTDGFAVTGTGGLSGGRVDSCGDHRLAMLGAVAGLASAGGVEIEGFEAAAVSYPAFERDLRTLATR